MNFHYSINTNVGDITFSVNMTEEEMIRKCEQQLVNESNPDSCEREPNSDEIKLHIDDYDKKLRFGCTLAFGANEAGSRISTSFIDAKVNGFHYFVISKSDFEHVSQKHNEHVERERRLSKTVELNFKGKDFEKEGKIDEAIQCYEENVKLGYPAMMSYDRLLILYRKKKDYENEKRICLLTIDMCEKENERRLKHILSNEENKGLENQIINAHNENRTLVIEGRQFCVYNPYEVNKYKIRLEKINKKLIPTQSKLFPMHLQSI
jgi:hypothetical protein